MFFLHKHNGYYKHTKDIVSKFEHTGIKTVKTKITHTIAQIRFYRF